MNANQGQGPADAQLLVLISLAAGPKHGHAMLLDIASFAGQRLGPGTLYGAIERLEGAGLIEREEPVGRRVPYRLTTDGEQALARRLGTLQTLASAASERLAQ